jgi:hypothetical protein
LLTVHVVEINETLYLEILLHARVRRIELRYYNIMHMIIRTALQAHES